MYSIIYRSAVKKDLKKLDRSVLLCLQTKHLPKLSADPYAGERLHGEYRSYYKYSFTEGGIHYRIVYELKKEVLVIIVMLVGFRENFYKELKRRVKFSSPRAALLVLALALFISTLAP